MAVTCRVFETLFFAIGSAYFVAGKPLLSHVYSHSSLSPL